LLFPICLEVPRITSSGFISISNQTISDTIRTCVNSALADYSVDINKVIPAQSNALRRLFTALDPGIDSAQLNVTPTELSLTVKMSGTLTKVDADHMMADATKGWTIQDVVNFVKGRPTS
jgi:hypothetical protein